MLYRYDTYMIALIGNIL